MRARTFTRLRVPSRMVGLDAVVAFTDELERQLSRLEELPASEATAACDVVDRACRKLKIFLDELVNGAAPVPLKLYPEYEAMQTARGIRLPHRPISSTPTSHLARLAFRSARSSRPTGCRRIS
jgi:hypothetical protein